MFDELTNIYRTEASSFSMNSTLQDILKHKCSKSPITYRDFIETALYHPTHGYYTQTKQRVGRVSQADFYTSESLGKIFAELVLNSAQKLLKEAQELDKQGMLKEQIKMMKNQMKRGNMPNQHYNRGGFRRR